MPIRAHQRYDTMRCLYEHISGTILCNAYTSTSTVRYYAMPMRDANIMEFSNIKFGGFGLMVRGKVGFGYMLGLTLGLWLVKAW